MHSILGSARFFISTKCHRMAQLLPRMQCHPFCAQPFRDAFPNAKPAQSQCRLRASSRSSCPTDQHHHHRRRTALVGLTPTPDRSSSAVTRSVPSRTPNGALSNHFAGTTTTTAPILCASSENLANNLYTCSVVGDFKANPISKHSESFALLLFSCNPK